MLRVTFHNAERLGCDVGLVTGKRLNRSTRRQTRPGFVICIRNWSHSCCAVWRKTWKSHCRQRWNRSWEWRCPRCRDSTTSGYSPRTTRPLQRSAINTALTKNYKALAKVCHQHCTHLELQGPCKGLPSTLHSPRTTRHLQRSAINTALTKNYKALAKVCH